MPSNYCESKERLHWPFLSYYADLHGRLKWHQTMDTHKVYQMPRPIALLQRIYDGFEIGIWLQGNVHEDVKFENNVDVRAAHRRQANTTLTTRANLRDPSGISCAWLHRLRWRKPILPFLWSAWKPTGPRDTYNHSSETTINLKMSRLLAL